MQPTYSKGLLPKPGPQTTWPGDTCPLLHHRRWAIACPVRPEQLWPASISQHLCYPMAEPYCYGLYFLPHKIHLYSSNPQWDGRWKWGLSPIRAPLWSSECPFLRGLTKAGSGMLEKLLLREEETGTVAAAAKSLQLCLTLCDPIDGSPPGSPVPGILQARTLEWGPSSLSSAWKWEVKVKSLSSVLLFATPWTAAHQAPPSMGFSRQEYWSGVPLPSPETGTRRSLI